MELASTRRVWRLLCPPLAQECYFHKAVVDRKSPSVTSRLAKQSALMYAEVERLLAAPLVQQYLDKSWLVRCGECVNSLWLVKW